MGKDLKYLRTTFNSSAEWYDQIRPGYPEALVDDSSTAAEEEVANEQATKRKMAGRQGFEPRSGGPEPPVLPLDDLPARGPL